MEDTTFLDHLGDFEMEPIIRKIMNEKLLARLYFSVQWIIGPLIYAIGLLLSIVTGNLPHFLFDYPWACLVAVIIIASMTSTHFTERHEKFTTSMRDAFNITDTEFGVLIENNMRRLVSGKNFVFGLTFLPALLWAYTQRLWWRSYSSPYLYDAYYLIILIFILIYYGGMMFGAAVSCNLNVYTFCVKTPINTTYLLEDGQKILRKLWGGQILRITIVALIMSALTNVPILLYSGSASLLLNLAIALTLTAFIFVTPHYMFHRMLERAKENVLEDISKRRRTLMIENHEDSSQSDDLGRMLDLIYLTQYEGVISSRSTWVVDLAVILELLVVGSLHVTFMELLNFFT
jgi:hypothetical protein